MTFLRTLLGLARLAARVIRRALGPVFGVVSPLGWIVLLVAIGSAGAAWLFGWAEFLYLGLTLAAGLVIASLFLIGHASFRVEIQLTPRRVTAGERAFGRLLVTNIGARRSSATRLELPVGRGGPTSRCRRSPPLAQARRPSTKSCSPSRRLGGRSSRPARPCRCAVTSSACCGAGCGGPTLSSCSCIR